MTSQIQVASEAKNSSHTSTLAHETRKTRQGFAMFVMSVANQSGAMGTETISNNGRSLKNQISRCNFKRYLILGTFCIFPVFTSLFAQTDNTEIECTSIPPITDLNFNYESLKGIKHDISAAGIKEYTKLQNFERTLSEHGCFEKRLTPYDFLPERAQGNLKLGKSGGFAMQPERLPQMAVGIWFNYMDKFILLRTNSKNFDAIIIPFKEIRKIEILANEKTVGRETLIGNFRVEQRLKGLYLRIVTGEINRGTQSYELELLPNVINYWSVKHPHTQGALTCAVRIVDEIDNIMNPIW